MNPPFSFHAEYVDPTLVVRYVLPDGLPVCLKDFQTFSLPEISDIVANVCRKVPSFYCSLLRLSLALMPSKLPHCPR
jgi:hypothetical protein